MLLTNMVKGVAPAVALLAMPLTATSATGHSARDTVDVLDYVDPLIGTSNGGKVAQSYHLQISWLTKIGHVFAGASLPYGMAI